MKWKKKKNSDLKLQFTLTPFRGILSSYRDSQSLIILINAASLAEEQQIPV
jgi:hypothetical protein